MASNLIPHFYGVGNRESKHRRERAADKTDLHIGKPRDYPVLVPFHA